MFRPLIRLAKKGRLKKYKADGEFPLHRRQDYYEIPPTAGAAPSKPSVIRDLDDPTLDDSPPKQRRLKPHEIYPREEKRTSLNPGLAEHPTKVSADTSAELQIPEVDIVEAAKKFHWMPHPKTRPKGDEYFAKYFLARDRRLDGREKEFKKILDELPDEAKEANKRISPRKYWYSADYETPKAEDVPHMKSCEVKKVMMEEAHQVRKKQAPFNEELWTALAQRGAEVACGRLLSGESGPQCGALTTLRMLQALASVQVSVNAAIMQIVDRVTNEKRLKPQHHHFFLQALSRLRLRDARVFGVVEKMSLVWGVLPLKQLVRVSNAVAKLDLGSGVWARPLKDVLASQLPNLGARIQRLKSVAVVELLDEPERYLVEAFNQREHIRYSRHLQLVELFVRLRREEQWAAAGEEVKEWLEEIRDESYVVTGDDKPAEPSTLAASIASALRKGQSDWSFEEGQRVGPYFSDLWLFKKKILVEALCPYSFYVRTRHITSTARMRLQFLEMMGFQVKTIAYYDWPSDDRDAQTQFLQKMLNGRVCRPTHCTRSGETFFRASQTTDTESEIKPSHASDVRPGTRALPSPYTTSRKKRRTNSPRASPPRLDLALQFPTGRDVPSTRDAVSSTALHAEHLDAATPSRPPVRRMHGAMPSSLTIKHRAHDSPPPCGSASPRTPPPSRHVDGGALVTSKRTRAPRELKTVMKTTLKKKKGPVLSRSYGAGEHRIDGIDVVVSSVLLYGHLQPDNATDAQPLDVPVHYWRKRYFLFSRFDEGVMMDSAAWFETTPEIIAAHIAWRLSDCSTICDGTAGVGGNAVQFARQDMRVECVDINKKRLRMCSRNAKIYGVRDRLKFHVGDFCAVPPVVVDAVFLSPPWGGPECFKSRSFSLDPVYHDGRIRKREGVTCDIPQMFARATLWSRTVVLFLPHHTDLRSLSNLARKHGYPHFEAEKIYYQLGGKMHFKILTVYFGHPRRHSDA